jgi:hypothetical protein
MARVVAVGNRAGAGGACEQGGEVMNAIQMSAKLYEFRDAARSLLGAHYQRDMDLWAIAIKGMADADQCSNLAAATKMAREADGFGAIVVLAAYVEMVEPCALAREAEGVPAPVMPVCDQCGAAHAPGQNSLCAA